MTEGMLDYYMQKANRNNDKITDNGGDNQSIETLETEILHQINSPKIGRTKFNMVRVTALDSGDPSIKIEI